MTAKDPKQYAQRLPALDLAIERYTPNVPADGGWYLLRDGSVVDRYRSLKAAQEAWAEVVKESGWAASERTERSAKEMLAAERAARDRDARNEYWHSGRRHSW